MEDDPTWWKGMDDAEWEAHKERCREFRERIIAEEAERHAGRERWEELYRTLPREDLDAYLFNLTKLGATQTQIAGSFGLSSINHRIRRHKTRRRKENRGG